MKRDIVLEGLQRHRHLFDNADDYMTAVIAIEAIFDAEHPLPDESQNAPLYSFEWSDGKLAHLHQHTISMVNTGGEVLARVARFPFLKQYCESPHFRIVETRSNDRKDCGAIRLAWSADHRI